MATKRSRRKNDVRAGLVKIESGSRGGEDGCGNDDA